MRQMILLIFLEKEFFRIKVMHLKQNKKTEEESGENELEKKKDDYKNFIKYIDDESKGISYELFKKHFYSSVPSALVTII